MAKLIAILILISLVAASVYAEEKDEHHEDHENHGEPEGWGEWFLDWFLEKCGKGKKRHHHHKGHGSGSGGNGGAGGSTTPVPIRNCSDPAAGETIQQICDKICYDCECGDSSLNDTCYTNCTSIYFANDTICSLDVTTLSSEEDPDNPIYTFCALDSAEVSSTEIASITTDDFCNQACTCCEITDPNCFSDCQNSQLLGVMAQTCAMVQAQPSFKTAMVNAANAKTTNAAAAGKESLPPPTTTEAPTKKATTEKEPTTEPPTKKATTTEPPATKKGKE